MNKSGILSKMETIRDRLTDTGKQEEKLASAEKESAEVKALVDEYGKSVSIRENMFTDLKVRYRKAADAVKKCTYEINDMKRIARITEYFIEQLKSSEGVFTKFTEEMFRGLCDRMTVCKEGFVRVRFRNGVEIDVEY